jgi:hypothetical protein
MAIRARCSCGKQVQALDELAGRRVRCPACQGLVRLPGEPQGQAGYGIEKARKCPGCKREWPVDTVLCIDCGHNFETGRKLRTKYNVPDRVLDVGASWLGPYARYRVFRNERGRACLNVSRTFLFLPLGSATYDLSDYRAVLTDFAAGDDDSPDTFYLELEGRGERAVRIFRSSDEEKFKELTDLLAQAGRIEIKRK